MKNGIGGWTRWCEAPARESLARAEYAFVRTPRSTRLGSEANRSISGIFGAGATNKPPKTCKTSGWTAIYGLGGGSIRKKIIGHGMCAILSGFGGRKHAGHPGGTFALLEKPAGQQGSGVFFHPLINQSDNFLAEIGRVGQTRQFKTLQRVSRSGKKKLPRRLRRSVGHKPPLGDDAHINSKVKQVNNTYR